MNDLEERETAVRRIATTRHGSEPLHFTCPFTVFASPAWRGVEADIWLAKWDGITRVYKHYHPETAFYVNAPNAISAAHQAGEIGVSPRVTEHWEQHALVEMEFLGEGWRCGGLQDAADRVIRQHVVAAKTKIQAGPRLKRDADIFEDIRELHEFCVERGAVLPRVVSGYLDFASQAKQAMRAVGTDRVPCHRDGNISNVMIGPAQQVMLLDHDLAANTDPYEDIGCHLMEMFERDTEARGGFEEWTGTFNEPLFQRAMVYGILDDLRWGLIASGMAASSPRQTLEFAKYASWRYMRFEQNSQRSLAADRLRSLMK